MLLMASPAIVSVFGAAVLATVAAVIGLLVRRPVLNTEQELDDLTYRLRHPVRASLLHPVQAFRRRMVR
jgi:hypothetical protein